MTGLLLTLIAVVLAGVGARDQVTLAGLAERNGASAGLLATGIVVAVASASAAAWAATAISPMLTPGARLIFAAMALAAAGIESLLLSPGRKPQEPTHSLGALAIVLLAHQLTDAARFLVLAIAVATAAPIAAGVGGAAGGAVVLSAAWLAPEVWRDPRLLLARRAIGAVLLLVAAVLAGKVLL
ncbi:MAG: hypothetical protein RIQ46_671 [Pseudomonadota bacterium]